ncbi:MAG: L-seryl-tRNA(Sec) selenium transferase [Planctomycetes bacterium]|nr:L-seryl-tRNA(Sec) selenium transferase [Planctomycetota bacterium]MCP4772206.1 L-seryl-tRNA(Sec) selenium transferase [Planctomycetota bacterium]MCP4861262.1 L-seryl-tRNA(Sec) selenium transferase [Planctomycetota bacterium]
MNEILESCAERGFESYGREACRAACSRALDGVRARRKAGDSLAAVDEAFWTQVAAFLKVLPSLQLRGAINATGVVLHTNLGRAPWPEEAVQAAAAASSASLCEIDRRSGGRGRRDRPVSELLARVTGAEAGLPVNNNAATVLLAVSALARGRKVVVARKELVEIGGSYRMPEVIAAAGAQMVEIGTTNRVHLKDFESAMGDPEVSLVLRIHPSNFRIEGFTKEPPMKEIAALCRERGLPLVYDLGSGVLNGSDLRGLEQEHPVQDSLADGCDLVTFSGDKLLGGPQAGLIVGAKPLVERLRRDMLTRCLRLDKTMLAALEAVLSIHALGEESARSRIPALQRLSLTHEQLRQRASAFADAINNSASAIQASVVDCAGRVGSGASPTEDLPSAGVLLAQEGLDAEQLAQRLRDADPPTFARIQDEAVLLDLRTVADHELVILQQWICHQS